MRHNGDEIGETYALHGLGMVRHREGRYTDEAASLTNALRIARQIDEPLVAARVLPALGEMEISRRGSGPPAAIWRTPPPSVGSRASTP